MSLVAIYSTINPMDAQLVRSRLDEAGFTAFVSQELSALSTDGYSLATGGIQVQVPEAEAEEALAFLNADDQPSK